MAVMALGGLLLVNLATTTTTTTMTRAKPKPPVVVPGIQAFWIPEIASARRLSNVISAIHLPACAGTCAAAATACTRGWLAGAERSPTGNPYFSERASTFDLACF